MTIDEGAVSVSHMSGDGIGCLTFFFSSGRRHTRFDCDWSSDVCSSDLKMNPGVMNTFVPYKISSIHFSTSATPSGRSEERRVGKECRSRWSAHQQNRKT